MTEEKACLVHSRAIPGLISSYLRDLCDSVFLPPNSPRSFAAAKRQLTDPIVAGERDSICRLRNDMSRETVRAPTLPEPATANAQMRRVTRRRQRGPARSPCGEFLIPGLPSTGEGRSPVPEVCGRPAAPVPVGPEADRRAAASCWRSSRIRLFAMPRSRRTGREPALERSRTSAALLRCRGSFPAEAGWQVDARVRLAGRGRRYDSS